MRQLARRAQGRVIDFIQQRLGWEVVDAHVEEVEGYRDEADVVRLEIAAEFELDDDPSEYRYDPSKEAK